MTIGYAWPQRFLISSDFDDQEDYRTTHVAPATFGNAEFDMASVPRDQFDISWKDAPKERERDIALLIVGSFLGLIVTLAVEVTRKYA